MLSPAISAQEGNTGADSPKGAKLTAPAAEGAASSNGIGAKDEDDMGEDKPHVALRTALGTLGVVLSGYEVRELIKLQEEGRDNRLLRGLEAGGVCDGDGGRALFFARLTGLDR